MSRKGDSLPWHLVPCNLLEDRLEYQAVEFLAFAPSVDRDRVGDNDFAEVLPDVLDRRLADLFGIADGYQPLRQAEGR